MTTSLRHEVKPDDRLFRRAMTVEQLRAALEDAPDHALVLFTCDYGDICHTRQALPVTTAEPVDYGEYLAESAYSQSGIALESFDEDEDLNDDEWEHREDFVILS